MEVELQPVEVPEEMRREAFSLVHANVTREIKRGTPLYEDANPEKAAEILISLSKGLNYPEVRRTHGVSTRIIARIEMKYAEFLERWRDVMRERLEERFLMLEEILGISTEKLMNRVDDGRIDLDPDQIYKLARANSETAKQIQTIRGEPTQITEVRKESSEEEVKRWREEFLAEMGEAEVVEEGGS